ncbi:LysR family transcriptional regulator [Roseococcus sp. SDR]|uniref:LysR family transcriptional regulator n=1 Tax=Roseococcus sp. SDR TaxID=2835532 RepID=UPI001BCABD08|nr:LysR family transcriptional regulator [Roseococcus sp. SDR]MBS7792915.1 LysR family transcriptional regulator [Roseococcus sp. SDR]MBV1848229.1 LysR family transcriptional regulator [Roseococcus sp. SDR]
MTHDRALRYFLAVARAGSIRGAAEALNVAASAISRQVAELEAGCGAVLLERLPRGVALTEAGRIVAEHAERQADDAALLAERLGRLRGVQAGQVRLCCGGGFLTDLVENALAGFAAAHPGITYQVALGGTDRILAAVAEGEADLGLAYNPPAHPALRSLAHARQPLAALLRPGDPLRAASSLRAFAAAPCAVLPPDHGVRRLLGRVEADGGFRLKVRLETPSVELQRRFVLGGMGVTFLPAFAAATEVKAGQLVAVPLADPLLAEATTHLLVRAGRRLPEAVEGLAARVATTLEAFRPG